MFWAQFVFCTVITHFMHHNRINFSKFQFLSNEELINDKAFIGFQDNGSIYSAG